MKHIFGIVVVSYPMFLCISLVSPRPFFKLCILKFLTFQTVLATQPVAQRIQLKNLGIGLCKLGWNACLSYGRMNNASYVTVANDFSHPPAVSHYPGDNPLFSPFQFFSHFRTLYLWSVIRLISPGFSLPGFPKLLLSAKSSSSHVPCHPVLCFSCQKGSLSFGELEFFQITWSRCHSICLSKSLYSKVSPPFMCPTSFFVHSGNFCLLVE